MAFTKIVGAGIQTTTDVTVRNVQAGIVTATKFIGDISEATGAAAGLGTALSQVQSSPLNKIYFTDKVLSIGSTITVDPPDSSNVAYTQYAEIAVEQGYDLIVEDGDDLVPDILGLSTVTAAPLSGAGGRVRADQFTDKAGTGAPTFPNGVQITGVSTLGNTVVGGGTTQLVVTGNARITGILTIGTSSITLDGSNNQVNVGTGVTLHHTNGVQVGGNTLHSTVLTVNNINASGVVTATSFSGSGANLTGIAATTDVRTNSLVVSGVSTVAAGSTAAPSISPAGDSDTGIFFPSADTIAFGEGGAEALRINSSGNVGIGTANPSAKLDVIGSIKGTITSGTSVASTAGTSIDFTNIPSWVKRITVMFNGVSTNGTSPIQIQLGTSSGVKTSGYAGAAQRPFNSSPAGTNHSSGFLILSSNVAAVRIVHGIATIVNLSGNIWAEGSLISLSDDNAAGFGSGSVSLSSTLDRIRITTVNGTDTFDAGSINILYEG